MVDVADALQKTDIEIEIPDSLPVLPVRDIVVFPYMILPLLISKIRVARINHPAGEMHEIPAGKVPLAPRQPPGPNLALSYADYHTSRGVIIPQNRISAIALILQDEYRAG